MVPRSVFLDRDGTLNVPAAVGEYVTDPEDLVLLPGAAGAVRRLNEAGIWVGVVTNQRGVSLGRMPAEALEAIHVRLRTLLAQAGARLDGIWACPHGLQACDCRKPQPGLLIQARREFPEIDFACSAIIGDSYADVEAGQALGLLTVLLGAHGAQADLVVPDLPAAVEALLALS